MYSQTRMYMYVVQAPLVDRGLPMHTMMLMCDIIAGGQVTCLARLLPKYTGLCNFLHHRKLQSQ